jgi:hypothetical protein
LTDRILTDKNFDRQIFFYFWGSGSLYRKIISLIILTETPFDRTPFDRNRLTESTFDRIAIFGRLTESSFYRKKSFDRKQNLLKGRLAENIWKMVI